MSKANIHTIVYSKFSLEVHFDYTPSTPDVMYMPNGDPGYPGNDEELTLTHVLLDYKEKIPGLCIDLLALGLLEEFDQAETIYQQTLDHIHEQASSPPEFSPED